MNATTPDTPNRTTAELLREGETIYQAIFEASTDAIFMESLDGHVLDCNSAACKMFGYTRQELLKLSVADLVPPEVAQTIPQVITEELATGGVFVKAKNRRKSGEVFPVEVNTQLFSIGDESRAIVYVRDITERMKAEKVQTALYRISESAHTAENLDELYGYIHTIICELMPASNFYIARYDPAAAVLSFPYFADEADTAPEPQKKGRGLTEYVLEHGQPLLATPEVYEQLLAEGRIEVVGAPAIDWLGVPLISREKIIGVMAVQTYNPAIRLSQADQDVLVFVSTQVAMAIERKRADQALRDSETRLRLTFETTLDYIFMVDRSYKIQYINHVLPGLSAQQVVGVNALEFSTPEFREPAKAAIDRVFTTGEIAKITSQYRLGQQNARWYETNIGPIDDDHGNVVAAMLVSRDVTERRNGEEQIKSLNQELERQAEQLTLLYDAGLALNRVLDPGEQLKYLAQITLQALHAENSGFFRFDPVRNEVFFEFGVGRGIDRDALRGFRIPVGNERGLVGWIAQQRKPFYLPDVNQDPRWIVTDPQFCSALWVPVEHEDQLLGILSVASIRKDAFTQSDQQLLVLFANQVAVSLENARLYQSALNAAERSTTLHWLSQEIIAASMEPERIYSTIHQAVSKMMPVEAFVISVLDEEANEIDLKYCVDLGKRYPGQCIPRSRGLSGHVIATGKPLIIHDLATECGPIDLVHFGEAPFVRSILAVPMRLGDKIFGLISAQSYQANTYSGDDARLLEILAAYAAIALENSHLFTQMQASNRELGVAYEEMIEGWSRALEMRDKETKGHSERVTRLSLRLAHAMEMPEEEIVHFRRGVLLHDIGKMAIPDSILLKPSSLTDDEWIFMRQHPSYAYQMLSDIPFIRQSLDVPYCHHEKWDGSGYPRGLKGEEIPLGARIFTVVDVWDALVNDRPYRPAWLPDVVRAYIEAQSGAFFDPGVVAEFLKILDTEHYT